MEDEMEPYEYRYRRNPKADPMSLEGTETGYLLRMKTGYECNSGYLSEEYYKALCKELKIRGVDYEGQCL